MTIKPILYGGDYSVYVRIVRLALEEKGVSHDHVPVDIFAPTGPSPDYLARHPFGRIPAFEHDGFDLYETGAITRYIDEIFDGPRLQPDAPKQRARMNQLIGIADNYVYRTLVWDVYVERVNKPQRGEMPDEAKIAAALARTNTCFDAMTDLMTAEPWMVGGDITLADLYLAPMFDYFLMTAEGKSRIADYPKLLSWWSAIQQRPSMLATKYSL